MKITLDESTHTYTDETGAEWPGVTSILKDVGLINTQWSSQHNKTRGSAVHKAVELREAGTLDEDSLDPVDVAPYLAAWDRFKAETGFTSTETERVIWHPVYRYAGKFDVIGELYGKTALLDIKTGAYQKWWIWQAAGYNEIVKCKTQYSIELRDDRTWKITEHKDRDAFRKFLACLTVYNMLDKSARFPPRTSR